MIRVEISDRLDINLGRVGRLVQMFSQSSGASSQPDLDQTDLLRAAVVLLHATLEDVVRSVSEWKLPRVGDAKSLEGMRLVGTEKKKEPRFTLADLARYRGKSVDEVISDSVVESLKDSNYNHPGDLEKALVAIGLNKDLLEPHRDNLGPMIARRHLIVHRVDRDEWSETATHSSRTIDQPTVECWRDAVRGFCAELLDACGKGEGDA